MKHIFDTEQIKIMDGAMGTMLQAAGMAPGEHPERFGADHPDALYDVEKAYVEAGAQILTTNTFGANRKRLAGSGLTVEQAVFAAVGTAKKAAGNKAAVALDIGPLGEILQPVGTLPFAEAYALFSEVVKAGVEAGADLIIIETMADLLEIKAAVLAARENSELPVLASMTFGAGGRTFMGVPLEGFAAAIGGLGVAGLGINCSFGPKEVMPLLQRLCDVTSLPVFVQPNAGMPNALTGGYDMTPEAFCEALAPCPEMGVAAIGGCCGTSPEFIKLLAERFGSQKPAKRKLPAEEYVCGTTRAVEFGTQLEVGVCIEPTDAELVKELQAGDIDGIQERAADCEEEEAQLLSIHVAAPGIDEVTLLPAAVQAVQAISGLPLQLESADPAALDAALRVCVGRPVVKCAAADGAKCDRIKAVCARYGALML